MVMISLLIEVAILDGASTTALVQLVLIPVVVPLMTLSLILLVATTAELVFFTSTFLSTHQSINSLLLCLTLVLDKYI